jgi:Lar family restriction alleviation protein
MIDPGSGRKPADEAPELVLAPCPFCASTNVSYYEHVYAHHFAVKCNLCGAEGPSRPTCDDAGRMWNGRAGA